MMPEKKSPPARGLLRWICFIRAILGDIFVILYTAGLGLLACVWILITRSRKVGDFILKIWGHGLCLPFNIQIETRGLENLPHEGVLFVFNHTSHFDIPIFHVAVPKSARFGAKIELYKIPIFSQTLKVMGALPITRGDRNKVLELYRQSIPRVKKGESFVLAAEGTRLPHAGVGEKFKSGPFIFAIEGQFPIVPIVIRGASEILTKGRLLPAEHQWKPHVRVQILKPVPTQGLTEEDRPRLQAEIQNLMTKAFQEE